MAAAVATVLEREFSTIAGLESMSSMSTQGGTQITMQFSLSRNIDAASQDVQAAIARSQGRLPADMPAPPSYQKVNPADQPVLYMAVHSDTLASSTVDDYADTLMAQRISMINGVAQVQLYGAQKYAVRVQLDPQALATRGIGIDEVTDAIKNANVNLPTGTLFGTHKSFVVQANGQLQNAAAYRPLIVAYRNGAPVRLEALGQVIDSVQNNKVVTWYNGVNSMVLAIQRQPGTNTIEVVDNIQRLLPTFRQEIPQSIHLDTLYDASISIRDSVDDVKFTLYLTLCLVVLVIFLFLRNVSATIIPSLALPMSIVGTFAVMYLFGYTVDNLSLMALVLAVGFVVDDAIVMLENIVRHLEMGERRHGSGAARVARNQLHHSLHDPFAGRGLHPRAFHGRYSGAAAARILRDHHVGGPGVGRGLAHADAHAVQPLPAPCQAGGARLSVQPFRARPPAACWPPTIGACRRSCGTGSSLYCSPWPSWPSPFGSLSAFPRDSFPAKTVASSSASPWRSRAFPLIP